MAVEVPIRRQASCMLRQTGREQVGDEPRHRRRPEHLVEPLKATFKQQAVEVVEQVVHVLHRNLEVEHAKRVRQASFWVELAEIDGVADMRHRPEVYAHSRRSVAGGHARLG